MAKSPGQLHGHVTWAQDLMLRKFPQLGSVFYSRHLEILNF